MPTTIAYIFSFSFSCEKRINGQENKTVRNNRIDRGIDEIKDNRYGFLNCQIWSSSKLRIHAMDS